MRMLGCAVALCSVMFVANTSKADCVGSQCVVQQSAHQPVNQVVVTPRSTQFFSTNRHQFVTKQRQQVCSPVVKRQRQRVVVRNRVQPAKVIVRQRQGLFGRLRDAISNRRANRRANRSRVEVRSGGTRVFVR